MDSLLEFWIETDKLEVPLEILLPSNKLVELLRMEMIPRLVKIVVKETVISQNKNSLNHVMMLLFFYHKISQTAYEKSRDKNDPKMIDMTPVLFKISEQIIMRKRDENDLREKELYDEQEKANIKPIKYLEQAIDYQSWLMCDHIDCTTCQKTKYGRKKAKRKAIESFILTSIGQAFNRIMS